MLGKKHPTHLNMLKIVFYHGIESVKNTFFQIQVQKIHGFIPFLGPLGSILPKRVIASASCVSALALGKGSPLEQVLEHRRKRSRMPVIHSPPASSAMAKACESAGGGNGGGGISQIFLVLRLNSTALILRRLV